MTVAATLARTAPTPAAPAVACRRIDCGDLPVEVHVSVYQPATGAAEVHVMATPARYASIDVQLNWLAQAYDAALAAVGTDVRTAVLRRLFCSDPVNQAGSLARSPLAVPADLDCGSPDTALACGGAALAWREAKAASRPPQSKEPTCCAVSIVGQAPAAPARVALWAMHICDPSGPLGKSIDGATLTLRRGELVHHWTTGLTAPTGNGSHEQTQRILQGYARQLDESCLTLADHVMRTWFFVRDIDVNYHGLVDARRHYFDQHGLTAQSHFIASSGIGGHGGDPRALVAMDAYAIASVRADQVQYLKARDHLSPTHLYGVTFERATAVAYRDRRQVIVSGTASIDADGRIVHEGDVQRQLDRTLANIEALLGEADATLADGNSWIVYLRDMADHAVIRQQMRRRIGEAPMVIVAAPVCRPGWLVEIECLATRPIDRPNLPAF
ncbi:MAG: Rid family hydrolase [Phycisphaeraceae bacterium]